MKIAVTGATGLLGGQVVRAALADGHEVTAIVRSTGAAQLAGLDVRQVRAGLQDVTRMGSALRGVDGLVHCAAVYAFGSDRADEVARVNAGGTRSVIEAAAAAGVGRVVVTTSSVTCGSSESPSARGESAHLGQEPSPPYYASKVAQEEVSLATAEAHGIPVVLALPTVVLGGPFGRLAPSNAIVLRYLLDPTRSTYPGGCNVVDVRDVARGHLLLLQHGLAGQRYLLGGQDLTWRMLHTLVADLAGLPGPYAEVPAPVAWVASAAAEGWAKLTGGSPLSTREEALTVGRYYWYSSARAAALGYSPRPARDALAASLAWLVISGHVPRFVRETLRLTPEVRAARPLIPSPEVQVPSTGVAAATDFTPA